MGLEKIAKYMLYEVQKQEPVSPFVARIGNSQGGLKPYELMNQINGGGVNCNVVPCETVKKFLLDAKILPDSRVVRH